MLFSIVKIPAETFASYDYGNAKNGQGGYMLDAGNYILHIADDAHNTADEVKFNIASRIDFVNNAADGSTVKNVYQDSTEYMLNHSVILSREDCFDNLSDLSSGHTRRTAGTGVAALITAADANAMSNAANLPQAFAGTGIPSDHWMLSTKYDFVHPADSTLAAAQRPTEYRARYVDDGKNFFDLYGKELDDPLYDEVISKMSFDEINNLISCGGTTSVRIESIGKPTTAENDGPVGFSMPGSSGVEGVLTSDMRTVRFVSPTIIAASFNREMARLMGTQVGEEGLWDLTRSTGGQNWIYNSGMWLYYPVTGRGIQGWYGPAANTHRSPFAGRNFEYYSEDGFIGGVMMGEAAVGAQNKGIVAFIKHYFLNEQETNRNSIATWADEQTMREIHAKAFELAVKMMVKNNSKLMGIMSGMNRIGAKWAGSDYASMTRLPREEWGFQGTILTDSMSGTSASQNILRGVIAGNDKLLHTTGGETNRVMPVTSAYLSHESLTGNKDGEYDVTYGDAYKWTLRVAVKNILFSLVNSNLILAKNKINSLSSANAFDLSAKGTTPFKVNVPITPKDLQTPAALIVYYGDRSAIEYTFSVADGYSLPKGLTLSADGIL